MKLLKNKKFKIITTTVLSIVLVCSLACVATAQHKIELDTAKGFKLETVIEKGINWALGIISLIAVILFVWAGFTWMTSAGDETKQAGARKMMTAAIIGAAIAALAWGVVTSIFSAIF